MNKISALTLSAALLMAAPTWALDEPNWNQADAVKYSQQLAEAVEVLFTEARTQEQEQMLAATNESYLFREDLRSLRRLVRRLAKELEAGRDADETRRLFERIELVVRIAKVRRQRTPILANKQAEIDKANEVLINLTNLYSQDLPQVGAAPPIGAASPCSSAVRLEGVAFAPDSADVSEKSAVVLDQAAKELKGCGDVKIRVEGFTDSSGPAGYNQSLSEQRADSVKAHLVKGGVATERITTIGRGEDDPVAPNSSAAGRAQNRRVILRPTG